MINKKYISYKSYNRSKVSRNDHVAVLPMVWEIGNVIVLVLDLKITLSIS